MLNLGGPGDRVRRLYMEMIQSMVLYGVPVWTNELAASRSNIRLL